MSIFNLFQRAGRTAPARFPDGRVGFAVGDLHGRADLLTRMLDRLAQEIIPDQRAPIILFLGDYIDRGPASAAVLNLLLQDNWLPQFERRFLKGNHEEAMLAFLNQPLENRAWLFHGGLETLASYEVWPLPTLTADDTVLEAAAAMLAEKLPPEHKIFLDGLERYVELGDYVFVHAGIDPRRRLDQQTDADLYWIRERFLDDKRVGPQIIVHGHTPAPAPYRDERRVGLDTGAYASGLLSAARFEGEEVTLITVAE